MTVHVFGGISSQSCSNYALKKTAAENVKIFIQNLYEDDMLKNFPSAKIAANMIHEVRSLCKKGGFNLTRFSSNYIEVLKSIPDKYKKDRVKDKDLNLGILPEEKALDVKWNNQEDTLGFIIKEDDKLATPHGHGAVYRTHLV